MNEHTKWTDQIGELAASVADKAPLHSPGDLLNSLRYMTKELRSRYARVSGESHRRPWDEWLCDNYYVLEKESKQSQRELRRQMGKDRGGELGRLFFFTDQALCALMPPLEDEVVSALLRAAEVHGSLSERQFSFAPTAIKMALIHQAYRACLELESDREIAYAIVSLSKLSAVDFDGIIQECSAVEQVLRRDPAGVYESMSSESRTYYRYLVSRIALRERRPELAVANGLLEQAEKETAEERRHIGHPILHHPALLGPRRRRGRAALWLTVLAPLGVSLVLAVLCGRWWVGALCYFPLWEILRTLINQFALSGVDVDFLPRMDLRKVENRPKTAVLVSTLLPKASEAKALFGKLEQMYFSNSDPDLYFCVLADFKEWDYPSDEKDESQVAATRRVIEDLNRRYGGRFLLFLRGRTYNRSQGKYSGWERKRGAITEFVRFLKGGRTSVHTFVGDREALGQIRYLIALDADTRLLFESAQTLVAAAMHPLNRPVVGKDGVVVSGYGILTPKISTDLDSAKATPFSRVLSGSGGVTAYDTKDKDFYQDLFGESIFAGKGLIHVDAFYQVLNDRFPENRVLSHDILEGAYLRCGFVSDVEMTDQTPSGLTSWLARLHRWIRGDWQNLPMLGRRYKAEGRVYENPIGGLSRYMIFDNLRRSLAPAAALICLGAALFASGPAACALAWTGVLALTFSSLWAALFSLASGGLFTLSRKFFTRTLSHTFELMAQGLFFLVMAPAQALSALDAALRSLWRTFVSRKRMLEWTTAAQSDGKKAGFWACVRRYWPAELLGLVYLALSLDSALCLVGVAFCLVLPLAYVSARPSVEDGNELSSRDRDTLISYNAAMWRYYEDFADSRNHFLPPDNVQQSPVYRVANRTSPTNIGMLLLSILAAKDFDFIDAGGLYARVDRTLSTVERLEKWHGNLYNWYDTETLELLRPAFVSLVDSGNFVCCLVALREGLREFLPENPAFQGLIDRIRAMEEETDFLPFYNEKKHLFSIGWDVEQEAFSTSHYDFLMSECRLASYYAVAKKLVDKKHWGTLGRTMSRSGSYAGPVSWTGTMFEYYMPHLLLPVYEGSLVSEALIYCLYCQKKLAKSKDVPWGISESAFYAFDNNLNYQYKAHGVQKLGVKRHLDRELVISPYSTFITIPQNPNSSMANLGRLRDLGVYGRYGFFEAVDFTPHRVGKGALAVTRSYMAHHIGMSMIASCNAIHGNRMQRRFMADPHMKSASEFLQEKIAKNTVVYDELDAAGERGGRHERPRRMEESNLIDPQCPRCALLTNGEITDILTDSGPGYLKFGSIDVTRRSPDLIRRPQGFVAVARVGGQAVPLTKAPFFVPRVEYAVEHQEQCVTYYARKKDLEIGMRCLIHPTISCQQRQIVVKNTASKKELVQVLLYLEPVLASYQEYSAHPAYSKLFVTAGYNQEARTITFTRRNKSAGEDMYLTVGFLQDVDFSFETRRERIMSAPNGLEELLSFHKKEFSNRPEGVPDACCALRFDLLAGGNSQAQATLLLSATRSLEEGTANIIAMRKIGVMEPKNAAKSPLLADTLEGRLGCNILGRLLFNQAGEDPAGEHKLANTLDQSGLWGSGISGDLPLVLIDGAEEVDPGSKEPPAKGEASLETSLATLESYLRLHASLRNLNVEWDLVILYREQETREKLLKLLEQVSVPSILGARGGVFLLDREHISPETLTLLRAVSRHTAARGVPVAERPAWEYRPARFRPSAPAPMPSSFTLAVEGGAFSDGRFYVDKSSPLPWCHPLSGPAFGALVSDRALGYTWMFNARENKLTPWYNDVCADNQGEMLVLRDLGTGEFTDLVNGARASFAPDSPVSPGGDAQYQGKAGQVEAKVRVRIAQRGCAKILDVELENGTGEDKELELAYYVEPVLGVSRDTARFVAVRPHGGNALVFQNSYSIAVRSAAVLAVGEWGCRNGETGFLTSRASFLGGRWEDREVSPKDDPCAAAIVPIRLPAGENCRIRFILSGGRTGESAVKMAELHLQPEQASPVEEQPAPVWIDTPDPHLNHYINHFAPHQILHSRIRGRTAFYQCGGAYGFRDQLQDAAGYLAADPRLARQQIVRCCGVQFEEGDVLHWWHRLPGPNGIKGVRTRFSDDLLWLPLTVAEYVEKTGDAGVLNVPVPYLQAPELADWEHEKYISPARSQLSEDVFRHCVRAVERGYRVDGCGLPYIGCGDWNDGFSSVGLKGKGTSVWLALFLCRVLDKFAALCAQRGERELEKEYRERIRGLREAVDAHCWDGSWYVRAFYDDGTPMGSSRQRECSIDLLPQSFAALTGMPDRGRVNSALTAAWERLVDEDLRLVRLFREPFHNSDQTPGYVKAYPPGIRENGGQYTHGAIWFALALLENGRTEDGWRILKMLNPLDRASRPELAEQYLLEPYYIAADIYTNPGAPGRGGWSMYTGAAAWYYRAVLEGLLGLRLLGSALELHPRLPAKWPGARLRLGVRGGSLDVEIARGDKESLVCDGREVRQVPLDGRDHRVKVTVL